MEIADWLDHQAGDGADAGAWPSHTELGPPGRDMVWIENDPVHGSSVEGLFSLGSLRFENPEAAFCAEDVLSEALAGALEGFGIAGDDDIDLMIQQSGLEGHEEVWFNVYTGTERMAKRIAGLMNEADLPSVIPSLLHFLVEPSDGVSASCDSVRSPEPDTALGAPASLCDYWELVSSDDPTEVLDLSESDDHCEPLCPADGLVRSGLSPLLAPVALDLLGRR